MTASNYDEANRVLDDFDNEYSEILAAIGSRTAGEGVFVKPFMKYMGRPSGPSRLPSVDNVVTDEITQKIKKLMDRAPSII
jgi:hypothetical protein